MTTELQTQLPPNSDGDICSNYHGGNPESVSAFEDTKPTRVQRYKIILAYLADVGPLGATCFEIEKATGLIHQVASARCSELKRSGIIRPNNLKRRTSTGSLAAALEIVPPDQRRIHMSQSPGDIRRKEALERGGY